MTEASSQRANMGFIGAIVAVATIGGFLFGYDSGAVNGTQDGLTKAFNLVPGSWSPSNGLGFTVASLLIGCFIGAFFAGRLADLMGRRNTMMLAAALFLIGALVQGAASSHIVFVLARICGGMAVGAASVLSPAYISEVAPANIRGRLTTVQQIMIITGLTAAFVVNYFLAQAAGVSTARILGRDRGLALDVPDAGHPGRDLPRRACSSSRKARATSCPRAETSRRNSVLTSLFGADVARAKLEEIRATLQRGPPAAPERHQGTPGGGIRPIVWVGIMLAAFQQFVGINVIFYYGATLWQLAGFTESQSLLINIVSGAVSIAACFVTIAVIDKIGRKPLLLIGSAGMAVTLFAMVYAFSQGSLDPQGNLVLSKDLGTLAVVAANLYVIFFNFSWGPVMWVMLGEMFPNQIRGSALAVSGFVQWFANFLISFSFPVMAAKLGLTISYTFYAVCAVISFFLVQKLVHETRGKELEQMEG